MHFCVGLKKLVLCIAIGWTGLFSFFSLLRKRPPTVCWILVSPSRFKSSQIMQQVAANREMRAPKSMLHQSQVVILILINESIYNQKSYLRFYFLVSLNAKQIVHCNQLVDFFISCETASLDLLHSEKFWSLVKPKKHEKFDTPQKVLKIST